MKNSILKSAALLGAVMMITAACGAVTPKKEVSLYERLGGQEAIETVVGDFIDTVGGDTRITNEIVLTRLGEIDIPTLKTHVSHLVCGATGGPCEYKGRDMKTAHAGLKISDAEFDYVVEDLVKT
ncbi:MAG TPA: group 1 truncated hemoglobin, partial [Nitrospiria bacterium]|nr:group 1 truncated hemoglobin [Nitrospiria bacterium]